MNIIAELHQETIPIQQACAALGLPRSSYYRNQVRQRGLSGEGCEWEKGVKAGETSLTMPMVGAECPPTLAIEPSLAAFCAPNQKALSEQEESEAKCSQIAADEASLVASHPSRPA